MCLFVHHCVFELRHRSSEVMNCSLNFSSRRDGVCVLKSVRDFGRIYARFWYA